MKIDKSILGVAGEFAVATELCKRNVYAQLTLGNQKKVDLLVFNEENLLKIEVKCKQGREWPGCKGIHEKDSILVFVDFAKKTELDRPDFYILSTADWSKIVLNKKKDYHARYPKAKIEIKNNVMIWLGEVGKSGKPYVGCGIVPSDIGQYKEKWDTILKALNL